MKATNISSQHLSQPAYRLSSQLFSYEQPFSLKIYTFQAICFIYVIEFAFFVQQFCSLIKYLFRVNLH